MKDCLRHRNNFILIVDEAQNLSYELLEEIRLLSNMETGDEKLLNIFLVGQPELNDRLTEPRCKPILQRISIRYHIQALDLESTKEYVATKDPKLTTYLGNQLMLDLEEGDEGIGTEQ